MPWSLASIVLLGGMLPGAWRVFATDSVVTDRVERPVWIDMPPVAEKVATPPPPPSTAVVRETPEPVAAPVQLSLSPDAAPDPDPSFGLDDAVATGGLAVAAGSTLAREPDPVVREPGPPPGPIALAATPASVHPVVPRYPPRAEALGLEARVVVLVTTDSLGNVVDVGVERSGGREFDVSVRQAVLATRFVLPRGPDGRVHAAVFRLPYDFRME